MQQRAAKISMYFFARPTLCLTYPHVYRDTMKPIDSLTDDEFTELVQRAAGLPDAPPEMLRAATNLWPKTRPSTLGNHAETASQIIYAVLSFDSWARPAVAFGMRSAGSDTRHLLFSAAGRDVDLRISRLADTFALAGQILGPDEAGTIELAADPSLTNAEANPAGSVADEPDDRQRLIGSRVTSLDELGEFRLDDVPAGTYRLTLRLGSDEIVLPPIVIGEKTA